MKSMPMAMTRFDFLQFEALIVRKISGHFAVRFDHDLVNTAPGLSSYPCKVRGRFIDYWRYFGDLFWRQMQLSAEPVAHSYGHQTRLMNLKKKMPRICRTQKSTSHSTSDEDEDEAGD